MRRISLFAVLLLFLMLPALLYGLLGSETGSRWLLNRLLRTTGPEASVQRIEGTLLDRLTLTGFAYSRTNMRISVGTFSLAWQPARLFAGELAIDMIDSERITVKLNAETPPTEDADAPFTLPQLPLAVRIEHIDVRDVDYSSGKKHTTLDHLHLRAALMQNRLTLDELSLKLPELSVTGHAGAELTPPQWPLSGQLHWTFTQPKLFGDLTLSGQLNALQLSGHVDGALQLQHRAQVDLSSTTPAFNASVAWQRLQWPLTGAPRVASNNGRLTLDGTLAAYRLTLDSRLASAGLPPFALNFIGAGSTDALTIEQLNVSPKQGRLSASGRVSWQHGVDFDLQVQAKNLDTGAFSADLPGVINLQTRAEGHYADGDVSGTLNLENLDGKLFGSPLKGAGKLAFGRQRLTIERLNLQSGSNRLSASGKVSRQAADLDATLDAPHLAGIWPGLGGAVTSGIKMRGSFQHPELNATVHAAKLRYQDQYIEQLDARLLYAGLGATRSTLDLTGKGLQANAQTIDEITLQASGTLAQHQLHIALASGGTRMDSALNGSYRQPNWTATLEKLDLEDKRLQKWQLERPWPLNVKFGSSAIELAVARNCLRHAKAALCLSLNGKPNQHLQAEVEAVDIDLALAAPWLPKKIALSGLLAAKADAEQNGAKWTANATLTLPKAVIDITTQSGEALKFPISTSKLDAHYRNGKLAASARIGLNAADFLSSELNATPLPDGSAYALSGGLQASLSDWSLLDALTPDIENLHGRLTADLKLTGSSAQPDIIGQLHFGDASLDLPKTGIHLKPVDLTLRSLADQSREIQLTGRIGSDKGTLHLDGQVRLDPDGGFPADIKVTGNAFTIAKLPEAEISVSPRIAIKWAARAPEISGEVEVDKAELKLIELSETAIAPSDDEVIVGQAPANAQEATLNMHTELTIKLKDHVHFSGFGIDAQLTGKLRYTGNAGAQRMQGQVAMNKATYKAYGQNLTIDKGELLFNGPLDNPWMNIQASRKASGEDVTALLTVTGPLQSPETKVSAKPSLPESEALAYLLTGHSLQRASGSEAETLAKAALSYGAGEMSWLSNKLGFDQFEIEDSKTLQDSALRMGKYINPDLYLGLSLGLFSNTHAVTFKQKLNKYFSVETRAGQSQRLDLKYRLESD